jgi:hypothetical protein
MDSKADLQEEKRRRLTAKDYERWEVVFHEKGKICIDGLSCNTCEISILCDTIINHESKLDGS